MNQTGKKSELKIATMDDWQILLEWRNDIQTRKNSLNMEIISERAHKDWLDTILKDGQTKVYIWLENGNPAGTIRKEWDEKTKSHRLSWTVSPDYRGRGVGKNMVRCLVRKWNGNLRAEIKLDNPASVKIAEWAGLKFKYEENGILHYSNY